MSSVEKLTQAVMNGEVEEAEKLANAVLEEDVDFKALIEKLGDAMSEVGDKFEKFEVFLPEMIGAADAMMKVMEVIQPKLQEQGLEEKKGKVVMGAPAGDMHEIGKDIFKTILSGNGYEIVDLGYDNSALTFVNAAVENKADIIAISALMTTTMPGVGEVVEVLQNKGVRDQYKVIAGGAPTYQEWADEVGADGWAPDAFQGLQLVERLMKN